MSYILDALKKIEREKIKKTTPRGMTALSGELFNERLPPSDGRRVIKIVLLVVSVSLLTFTASWMVLKGDKKKTPALTTQNASFPQPAALPVNQPQPVPAPPPLPASQPVVQQPPAAAVTAQPPVAMVPSQPASTVTPAAASSGDEPSARRSRKRVPAVKSSAPLQPKIQAPGDIKLSGIAWQEERGGRRAVINDFLLHEGSVVAGAKVTEILADRVRFSSSGGVFEIRLNAVLPAEQKR